VYDPGWTMNRVIVATVAIAALAGASVLGWFEVRQAREFRRLLAVGDAALARDQTSAAIEAFSGAIALRRDSMSGWLKRGDTYRRRGDYGPAYRDLRQAAALDPAAPRPIELLGDVSEALGDHARAVDLYARFIALDERSPRVLYKLALAYYRGGRPAAATDPVRKALAFDRQLPEAYYLLGLCERDTRHPALAAEALMQAVSLNPGFAAAREELAAVNATLGRRRETVEQLEALAALQPARSERVIELAQAYARSGRFETAVLTLDRTLEQSPGSGDAYLAAARIWLDLAEDGNDSLAAQKAAEALRRAAARDAASPDFLLLRGRSQLLANDAGAAERSLEAATRVLPVDPAAFRYLSAAAARLGHDALARTSRARFLALTD
jgi:tetratricopeptide (TPR) repeat protein